jgi:hypothetical protein
MSMRHAEAMDLKREFASKDREFAQVLFRKAHVIEDV